MAATATEPPPTAAPARAPRSARIALLAGLALIALALCAVLAHAPAGVAHTNGIVAEDPLGPISSPASVCQAGETLPRGTTAIVISLSAFHGPPVTAEALSGANVLTRGQHGSDWSGRTVTIPVKPLARTFEDVTICFAFSPGHEAVSPFGQPTSPAIAATDDRADLPGRMRAEYLTPGSRSWWSLAASVADHMGLGRAVGGIWIVLVAIALAVAATATAAAALLEGVAIGREALGRVPRAALLCALVAGLSAACWSIVTPAFQVPDEQDHYAYVEQLAQTGRPPTSRAEVKGPEEVTALIGLRYLDVRHQPRDHTISSRAEQQTLERELAAIRERHLPNESRAAGVATSEPPLYYALETLPYHLAGTVLGRLPLMRLLSALMAAITALFAYLFVRETLPRVRWAWTVGGLGVALVPLLGFVSGAVNPDSMLFAVSAVLFYCLARGFRRGLTSRLALATGAVIAIGLVTKLNFIGLVPGALAGLIVLSVRAGRASGRAAYRWLALACLVAASPVVLYAILNTLSNHPRLGIVSGALASAHPSLAKIGYIWQLYLPRLPGMANDFPGLFTTRQLWFNGYVGLYGWFDTTFPGWVYEVALIPAATIAALCVRELLARRAALGDRLAELAVYALMAIGVMALVGAASYSGFPARSAEFAEARYLLPLLSLLAAMLALAARGAGKRWGPAVGVSLVLVFLAHDIFSQLLVVSRFYG